jgi:rRNA maturation endonuclease Nob1
VERLTTERSPTATAGTMVAVPPSVASYLDRLRAELADIRAEMDALLDASTIRNVNPNTSDSAVVFVGAADWGWGPSDPALSVSQMRLAARYHAWFDRFGLLFTHPTPDVASDIKEVDEFVRRWTERPGTWDHSIPRTIDAAKQVAAKQFETFDRLLDIASRAGSDTLRLVPDTNAFIRNPDLASYACTAPSPTFTVHLAPTVLAELDDLKDRGRNQELRDQAQGVVRRLKGLRDKGNLATGVKVTKTITVQTEAREVDVLGVLDWLDPAVPDDRLLAAALRLQSDHPSGAVVLVTSDLNLQNKADAVGLPYIETPPTTASLRAKLTASLRWPDEGPPLVTLTNEGPATARSIEYAISTLPDAEVWWSRVGPWTVDRLDRNGTDEQPVYGFYAVVVLVTVTWTDDDGAHELSWTIEIPEKPTGPRAVQPRSR